MPRHRSPTSGWAAIWTTRCGRCAQGFDELRRLPRHAACCALVAVPHRAGGQARTSPISSMPWPCSRPSSRPPSCCSACSRIETRHGRVRGERNAPRTLDLDLLLYGDAGDPRARPGSAASAHARARLRAAAAGRDRAGSAVMPGRGQRGATCSRGVADQRVDRESMAGPKQHRYIVVEGPIGAGKTSLARLLAEHAGADTAARGARRAIRFWRASTRTRGARRWRRSCFSCSSA